MARTKRCIYCSEAKSPDEFSEEHIIPQFMGGTSDCAAAVTRDACQKCNSLFGQFVDGPVARGYFLRSIEQGSWAACFDFNENTGNVYPLTYFGKSREIQFGDDEEVEVWLCPDGGTAWHVHAKQPEDFNALAGGDPVLRRKDEFEPRIQLHLVRTSVLGSFKPQIGSSSFHGGADFSGYRLGHRSPTGSSAAKRKVLSEGFRRAWGAKPNTRIVGRTAAFGSVNPNGPAF